MFVINCWLLIKPTINVIIVGSCVGNKLLIISLMIWLRSIDYGLIVVCSSSMDRRRGLIRKFRSFRPLPRRLRRKFEFVKLKSW